MLYLLGGFFLILAVALLFGTTRTARLKRMARGFNLRYQSRVDIPLTPLSAKEMKFFGRGVHRFSQVLTWEDQGAFVRACEDRIFATPSQKSPQMSYTLWTAELTRGTFVPFILIPRSQGQFIKEAVFPPELSSKYALIAPQGYQLPAKLVDLLKKGPDCYVETSLYSLVYHEYRKIPVSQMQQVRFHVKTFVKALSKEPKKTSPNTSLTAKELQTSAMLTLQNRSRTGISMPGSLRLFYVIGAFFIVTGLLLAARYFLQTLVH